MLVTKVNNRNNLNNLLCTEQAAGTSLAHNNIIVNRERAVIVFLQIGLVIVSPFVVVLGCHAPGALSIYIYSTKHAMALILVVQNQSPSLPPVQ
mmetsp:Transcript_13317/g.32328  ORF Transcript_13317/g.32328 Transcript_13317/m.32328 type:complete len:94 (+) Transcript_13317:129-410(+)